MALVQPRSEHCVQKERGGYKQQEQLEVKKSSLRKELILLKAALNKATLEKEVSEIAKMVVKTLSKICVCTNTALKALGVGEGGPGLTIESGAAIELADIHVSQGDTCPVRGSRASAPAPQQLTQIRL